MVNKKRKVYQRDYRRGNVKMAMQQEEWTKLHPDYHQKWRARNPKYYVQWRRKNPEYFKIWAEENREHRRNYMLHYMRKYRKGEKLKNEDIQENIQISNKEEK